MALIIDVARKDAAFLEGKRALWPRGMRGDKLALVVAKGKAFLLFFPRIPKIHVLIEIEQFIASILMDAY